MLDRLKKVLRQGSDSSCEAGRSPDESNLAPDNVTHLTPAPLPPKVGEMSDLAEAAVDELSSTLSEWFENDLRTLFASWENLERAPLDPASRKEVFRAAHNLSGMGETYGQPEIGRLCKSLCTLFERTQMRQDLSLASLHIDACRALQAASPDRQSAMSICEALEAEVDKLRAA